MYNAEEILLRYCRQNGFLFARTNHGWLVIDDNGFHYLIDPQEVFSYILSKKGVK